MFLALAALPLYTWDIYAHRTAQEQTVKLRIKLLSPPKGSCIANMKYYEEIIGGMVSLTRLSWKFTPIARPRQTCRSDPRSKNVFTLKNPTLSPLFSHLLLMC